MCKASKTCSELGNDPDRWSRLAPLMPPAWFFDEFVKFRDAIRLAAYARIEDSRHHLATVRDEDLRTWYVVHGQYSGGYRNRHYQLKAKLLGNSIRGKPPSSMLLATYQRDHYRCRYCGLQLFPIDVLHLYESAVGSDAFASTAKNASHGAALVFRCTYDHVDPLNCGGKHSLNNLVTACYSCNFGKAGYTTEQLGIDDPRTRSPLQDDWDGLVSLMPQLRRAGA